MHDTVLPLLKPSQWAAEAGSVLCVPFFAGEIAQERNPVIAYGVDENENIRFLNESDLTNGLTSARLHAQALENLRYILADHPGWEALDMEDEAPGLKPLIYTHHYYSAEALLVPDILRQAHKKLNASRLAVSAPVRGRLFAVNANIEQMLLKQFIVACLHQYFRASAAPISSVIWLVEDGEVAGFLEGTEAVEAEVARQVEAEEKEKEENVTVRAMLREEDDGNTIDLLFMPNDPAPLYDIVQQTIRQAAQQGHGDASLSGRIRVMVTINDTLAPHKPQLEKDFAEMIAFINKQLTNIGLGPKPGQPFTVQYLFLGG